MNNTDLTSEKWHGYLKPRGWVLTLGAGTSRFLAPSWLELARDIFNETFQETKNTKDFNKLVSSTGWGLDAWIQGCANMFIQSGKSFKEFYELLESKLYGDLRTKAKKYGLEKQIITALNNPRGLFKEDTIAVCSFIEKEFPNSSLLALVKVLLEAAEQNRLPRAVITFNADTLFHTVFELFQRRDHYLGPPPHSHPKYYFKTIMRGLDGIPSYKVPIFHCHGAIKPIGRQRKSYRADSRDKLVFLENEYLGISTKSSSWQENTFMFYAHSGRMVFLGLSMADSNIRRWLSCAHSDLVSDLKTKGHIDQFALKHLWITSKSNDMKFNEMKKISIQHLGVKTGLINAWSDLEVALCNLMALKQ